MDCGRDLCPGLKQLILNCEVPSPEKALDIAPDLLDRRVIWTLCPPFQKQLMPGRHLSIRIVCRGIVLLKQVLVLAHVFIQMVNDPVLGFSEALSSGMTRQLSHARNSKRAPDKRALIGAQT
jgi:hypothetical protein